MAEQAVVTAERVGPRAGWVYLDPDDARSHPDYGVFGWALFLLGVLFVGPMILLWQDVEIAFGPYDRPDNAWILLIVDAVLLVASWTACRNLGAERRQFYPWFLITVVLAMCSLAAFVSICLFDVRDVLPYGVREPSAQGWAGLFQSIPGIVWWGIILRVAAILLASVYVLQSRRLNVTVAKRVIANDPFVERAWNAPAGRPVRRSEPASARYPDAAEEAAAARSGAAAVTVGAATTRVEPQMTPPPPAAQPAEEAPAPQIDDRRLRARLKQLDDARAAGLISDAEYEARRMALINQAS